MPEGLRAYLRADAWELPPTLRWLAAQGKIPSRELMATFNCGLGMVFVVAPERLQAALALLREHREEPLVVGELISRGGADRDAVEVEGADSVWLMLPELGVSLPFPQVLSSLQDPFGSSRCRAMVLAGSEVVTPIQALIDVARVPAYSMELVGVVSQDPKASALGRANVAGIWTSSLCGGLVAGRDANGSGGAEAAAGEPARPDERFSAALEQALESRNAELLVVLDDVDLELLTTELKERWLGRALAVHASLLPAFPGPQPIQAALREGVAITGCTVSFLVPKLPVVAQEVTRIVAGDTADSLRERVVSECEWRALPEAVQLVATGRVKLDGNMKISRSASFSDSYDAAA